MSELLQCTGLTKRYGGKLALDHVELQLGEGKIVGLLGPNGSGKTTLMKLANGLLQPTEGSITIAGNAPGPDTKKVAIFGFMFGWDKAAYSIVFQFISTKKTR